MLDLIIIAAFVVYAISSGLRARKAASQDLDQYFLAGRTIKGWRAGVSMAATQFSADTPLLVMGLIATGGIFLLWRLWIYGLAFLLMGFVFAAAWRRSGVLTDAELTELRYSGRGVLFLRTIKALYYGTLINCVVLAMVLVAASRIAEVFLPWHEWLPESLYSIPHSVVTRVGVTLGESVTGLEPMVMTTNNLLSVGIIVIYPFTELEAAAEECVASRELLFVTGIQDMLPPGITGLMLVGLLAALVSIIAAPPLIFYTDQEWIRLGTMALLSTSAAIGITFITPSIQPATLAAFYQKVRPMSLWSITSKAAGITGDRPLYQLLVRLRTTAFAAISAFAMLIGLGKLFVRPPGEGVGWALVSIALIFALLPSLVERHLHHRPR